MTTAQMLREAFRAPSTTPPDPEQTAKAATWSTADTLSALGWMLLALLARGLLMVRIEGMLDHDQGVVGLMALDISQARRWPIFFDGQRYMGAIEAYTAALFVRLLGHSPAVVALAPTLYFGLFVAGQFALWRSWAGRASGHLAALIVTVGAPMLALWGIAPRGGYSELLAWAVPVLAVYRAVINPAHTPLCKGQQVAWGFLLAFGFFLNPLSLVVYLTLGLDWLFGREGQRLRQTRKLDGGWVDTPWAPVLWAALALVMLTALAAACHVELDRSLNEMRYVWALDLLPQPLGMVLGGLGVALVLGFVLWWTGVARRAFELLASHIGFGVGAVLALSPFSLYNLRAMRTGERDLSLPIWIRAPWDLAPNIRDGLYALRPLVGCDPHAAAYSVVGQFLKVPPPRWPALGQFLAFATPGAVLLALALVVSVVWRDRRAWRRVFALRGNGQTPPTVLATTGLAVCLGLYLLQATSANSTSIRYLLPVWIFLPGLLAQGLLLWPRPARLVAAATMLGLWTAAQAQLWANMDQPSPIRPVAQELERRGATGFVASTHIILLASDLTQGRLGGLEYHSYWPRLKNRFADRFVDGQPIVCVNDLEYGRPPIEDVGLRMRELAARHPGKVRRTWRHGPYEIWEADVPLEEIMALKVGPGPCPPSLDRRRWQGERTASPS